MLVSIMTKQLTLPGMSCILDTQLSIEVHGSIWTFLFPSFGKITNIYYIPKETALKISHYLLQPFTSSPKYEFLSEDNDNFYQLNPN